MTRDEVLEEFRSDACDCECDAWACIVDRAMADEIVRLRKERDQLLETKDAVFDNLFRTEEERDAYKKQRDEMDRVWREDTEHAVTLLHRAEQAERILAALREPSFDVRKAAWREEPDMEAMLRAAVAAAEREVAHDTP